MGYKLNRDEFSEKLRNVIGDLVGHVLGGAKKATKYLSPTLVIKATYQGKPGKSAETHTALVTIGSPNYEERKFIKLCKKAGESFPVKKIQLKFAKKATRTKKAK